MILVVGATGMLGSEICRRLSDRHLPVRALVRAGSPSERQLTDLGIELCHGDLRSPESLDRACAGVTAVISTATAMGAKDRKLTLRAVDGDGQLALVAAAKRAGVDRFVFISVSPLLQPRSPLVRYKRQAEDAVRSSGMRFTILQPSVFLEIWAGEKLGWDHVKGRAMIFGSGRRPMSWVSIEDVAELAVRSLEDPRLDNQTVPVAGPEALSPNEVVGLFERRSGRRYRVTRIPRPLLAAISPIASLFNEETGSGMALGAHGARGDVVDAPLQRELGLPCTSLEQYVEQVVGRPDR